MGAKFTYCMRADTRVKANAAKQRLLECGEQYPCESGNEKDGFGRLGALQHSGTYHPLIPFPGYTPPHAAHAVLCALLTPTNQPKPDVLVVSLFGCRFNVSVWQEIATNLTKNIIAAFRGCICHCPQDVVSRSHCARACRHTLSARIVLAVWLCGSGSCASQPSLPSGTNPLMSANLLHETSCWLGKIECEYGVLVHCVCAQCIHQCAKLCVCVSEALSSERCHLTLWHTQSLLHQA